MNVRIAQLISFNAGAWYDDVLEMNEYTIKLWMITQTYNDQEQNISLRRAKHFIFDQIENSIFVDDADESKCKEFIRAGLNVTTLPGDPADQLIGIMLYHKLNSIMEDRIKIVEIEISTGGGVVYLHGDNENPEGLLMPDWWQSSDLTHCDFELSESEKVVSLQQTNAWRDLDLAWPDTPGESPDGNIVVFADFKNPDETK